MQIGPGLDKIIEQNKQTNELLRKLLEELQKLNGTAR